MRVLITGASGFIGLALSNNLADSEFKVMAIARSIPVKSHNSITWIKSDLNSVENYIKEIISFKPEVLIHLAWQDIPDFSLKKSLHNLNQSTKFISFISEIESCKKILISGSCLEYGNFQGRCLHSDIALPTNFFTLAKHSLRLWAEMITNEKSISLGWLRLFYVYGPGQRQDSLIPTIFKCLLDEKVLEVRNPYNANDYIFIDDVIDAFKIATYTPFESGIFNIGSGVSTSALEVCKYAEKLILNSSTLSQKIEKSFQSLDSEINFWADITNCEKDLKWSPKVSLEEGIERTWRHLT